MARPSTLKCMDVLKQRGRSTVAVLPFSLPMGASSHNGRAFLAADQWE